MTVKQEQLSSLQQDSYIDDGGGTFGVVIAADGGVSHFPVRQGLQWDSHVRIACPAACWKALSSCACKPATHSGHSMLKVQNKIALAAR